MTLNTPAGGIFNTFLRLPAELRSQVWSLTAMEPRLVKIHAQKLQRGTDWLCSSPTPAIMHVCREARLHAPHTKAFLTSQARYAWVNFNVDMVVLTTAGRGGPDRDPLSWLVLDSPEAVLIRRFRFEARFPTVEGHESSFMSLGRRLKMLSCLRELQIIVPQGQMGWFASVTVEDRNGNGDCGWFEFHDRSHVHLIDRGTGLFLTMNQGMLQMHWELENGGLITEEEVDDYDSYAVKLFQFVVRTGG